VDAISKGVFKTLTSDYDIDRFDADEYPSKIEPKMIYRMLRMMAIHEKHIADLFRQTHGMKVFEFDSILKETAEDFGVPYEKLRDVRFGRFD